MDKRLKQKVLRWTYIIFGSIFIIISSYGAGTFFPNPFVKDKIIKTKEISYYKNGSHMVSFNLV